MSLNHWRGRQLRVVIPVLREIEYFQEIPDLCQAVARRGGWASSFACRRVVVPGGSRGVELVIHAGERGKTKAAFDEFQDRAMFVQLAGDIAALDPGWDDQHGYAHPHTVGVHLRWGNVIEE